MASRLRQGLGVEVRSFEYSGSSSGIPFAERISLRALATRLAELGPIYRTETGAAKVDVVAHSTGGLLVRAWMAGLAGVPYDGEIRRVVLAGTPNFGTGREAFQEAIVGGLSCAENNSAVRRKQVDQMEYGSTFLCDLTRQWQQQVGGAIHPENILIVVGCSFASDGFCAADTVVTSGSAALPLATPDYVIRRVRRIHFNSLVDVNDANHETYQLVSSFLRQGTADSFYSASSAKGLILAPLIKDSISGDPFTQTGGVQFGQQSPFGVGLPDCDSPFLFASPFRREKPSDPSTGLWTLEDVIGGGCWVVKLRGKYTSTPSNVTVPVGRPAIVDPAIVVRRK